MTTRWIAMLLGVMSVFMGCSLAPSDKVMEQFGQSERSWCVTVTSVYGTMKAGGTGIHGGAMSCTNDGLTVKTIDPSQVVVPITVSPQVTVSPSAPVK